MSVLFFDGFATTALNPAYWALTVDGVAIAPSGVASGWLTLSSRISSTGLDAPPQAAVSFADQTAGRVYIGFRTQSLFMGYFSPYDHKLCSFHAQGGAELGAVYIGQGRNNTELAVLVKQGATTIATYYLGSPITTVANLGFPNIYASNDTHWEFELDIDNDTFACRVNGQTMPGAASTVVLPVAFSSVASARLYGYLYTNAGRHAYFDDFYVINSTGTYANTWLGSDARVRARALSGQSSFTNEGWTGGTPTWLNTEDGDGSYYTTKTVGSVFAASFNPLSLAAGTAVAGVKIASSARAVSLAAAYKHAVVDATVPTTYEVGDTAVLTQNNLAYPSGGARTLVTFVNQNPITNAQWTRTQLDDANNRFGFKSVAAPP